MCTLLVMICIFTMCSGDELKDTDDQVFVKQSFDNMYYVGRFRSGTAVCATDENHWGIIDDSGEWIVNPVYSCIEDAPSFEEITDGLSPIFDRLYYGGFDNGFYLIIDDNGGETLMGFYCIANGVFIPPCWAEIWFDNPIEELIVVCDPETLKYGYINWAGELILDCIYDEAYSFIDGLAGVWSDEDGCFYVINTSGEIVGRQIEE